MATGEELRSLMRHFPSGVTVVTCGPPQEAEGMTASAVFSVSLDPPLMLVSVQREARLNAKVRAQGHYAVNFLAEDQEGLSRLFSSPERSSGPEAAHTLGGGPGETGAPLASGGLGSVECTLEAVYPGGDHDLFLGRVVAVHPGDERKSPLVYHEGTYPRLVHDPRPAESAGAFVDSARGFDVRTRDFTRRRRKR
ncbi:flavin reductase family protein [Rubrobacter radiotolerans]|uniref:Flavin reductase family protein n=1 Tax=Rubrobacter radiotolerans TaxID=42256 RepID=A0AB35T419_RUBRA|nr:flavin reductase family protein [Rubrobacter radiotolerans]MDX5893540.1 flavin reductase family protein [Rubrobacter radiotolerans]SMC03948.1 NADH-FMN oxidoreductase RutF, flavin reductase (DIM6/NTAB) family [Rubrobacter radiotolerans DSM 5868]